MSGYRHPAYARSLAGIGMPRELPRSGASILVRPIPGTLWHDGMGCYPLFSCHDWRGLGADLDELRGELVSLSLVTDPFGDHPGEEFLRECFPDLARPFKEHFVVDLSLRPASFAADSHRRNARKALQRVSVERCEEPERYLEDWIELYAVLVARHRIRGIPAFSREAFARQLRVPGLTVLRAVRDGATVGMTLWYACGEVGYYHLGAYSETGYESRASFALFWTALQVFADQGLRWLSLGAGAGLRGGEDGLTRFKRGWSTGTRTAWLCGRILDPARYVNLAAGYGGTDYFPAYRRGDFS